MRVVIVRTGSSTGLQVADVETGLLDTAHKAFAQWLLDHEQKNFHRFGRESVGVMYIDELRSAVRAFISKDRKVNYLTSPLAAVDPCLAGSEGFDETVHIYTYRITRAYCKLHKLLSLAKLISKYASWHLMPSVTSGVKSLT